MTSKISEEGLEKQESEGEEEEANEADFNTQHSDSTYGTESPEALGGAHPTPEDESRACSFSVKSQDDGAHLVQCTFSVSLGVPVIPPTQKPWMASRQEVQRTASKLKDGFIPRMHRFYHLEYFLLPDDTEPRKLDLVVFGPVAKLFLESEPKIVKPWLENDLIWISWNHSVEINVTNDFLIKLRDHKIKLRLWDNKEKVCSKARYSKPKFSIPNLEPGETETMVKRMIMNIRDFLSRNDPKPSYTKTNLTVEPAEPLKPAASVLARSKYREERSATPGASRRSSPLPGTSRRSSYVPGSRKSSYVPESRKSSYVPGSRKSSYVPGSRKSSYVPGSRKSSYMPGSRKSSFLPGSSRRSSSAHPTTKGEELHTLSLISISRSFSSSLKEKTLQEARTLKQRRPSISQLKGTSVHKFVSGKAPHSLEKKESSASTDKRKPQTKSIHTPSEKRQKTTREAAALAYARKFGIAVLQLDLMPLLSGERFLVSRQEEKCPKLPDAYLTFSVEGPLLSERQKHELNPLIIRINSARCLPATPVPIKVLQRSCIPVYCKYTFHNFPPHRTRGRDHGTEIFFKDINVILAGTIEPGEFREYLRGPPLEIEVHDRDKKTEPIIKKPSIFGDESGDNKLSNVSTVTSRYMVRNPITTAAEIWHPYGIAKIGLTELLLGERALNFYAPIRCCSVQDTSVNLRGNVPQKVTESDGSQFQLPMGHYVASESYLKVRIELTVPLGPEDELEDSATAHSPYGCIIYIFDYKNTSLLSTLLKEITEINAEALGLGCYSPPLIQQSLNTLKLSNKLSREEISKLDLITGFHILDGSIHLLVVEGLKDKALKRMWNIKVDRIQETKTGRLQILYNSHLTFHQRLYMDLEAVLLHVRLCKPLSSLMKQSLLYVRDMVPLACFEALSKLDYICGSTKLRDVVHHNLLPSAEMITTLSQEFGVPLSRNDLLAQQYPENGELYEFPSKYLTLKRRRRSPLDDHNEEYILRRKEMEKQPLQDHIQINIENVNLLSKMVKKGAPQIIRACPSDGRSVYNYSMQHLNSAEIANKLLRQEMAQDPERRYAYGHEYMSNMYDPTDEESVRKEALEQSKEKWMTSKGFVYPGFKSSIESNIHPYKPDESRMMELREKWQETSAGSVRLMLDRDRWTWDKRDIDFDIYTKPPPDIVIYDTSREEPPRDLCVNTTLKVHRCNPATELETRGPKASCQLARAQGLLKDKPMKLSLKLKSTTLTGVFDDAIQDGICKGFVPGSEPRRSLKLHGNTIPCRDRQHNLFKTLKGADFRLITRRHSFRYKKFDLPSLPLKDESPEVIKDDTQPTIRPEPKDLVNKV